MEDENFYFGIRHDLSELENPPNELEDVILDTSRNDFLSKYISDMKEASPDKKDSKALGKKRKKKTSPSELKHKCHCGKEYKYESSFKNHQRVKHPKEEKTSSSEARAKNKNSDSSNSKPTYYSKIIDLDKKIKNASDPKDYYYMKDVFNTVFQTIKGFDRGQFLLNCRTFEDNEFLYSIFCYESNQIIKYPNPLSYSLDDLLLKYLQMVYDRMNREYFEFSLIVIVLVREFIRSPRYRLIRDGRYSFSDFINAISIPECCCDFKEEFIDRRILFDEMDYAVKSPTEVLDELCFWLCENNLTSVVPIMRVI